jgi:hypothetical protein
VPVEVPPEREKATVAPPVERLFPEASRACNVTTTPDPEETVPEATVMTEFAGAIVPAVTVTVGEVVVTGVPPIVAPIEVAVPATAPVKLAV